LVSKEVVLNESIVTLSEVEMFLIAFDFETLVSHVLRLTTSNFLGLKGNPVRNRSCPRNCKSVLIIIGKKLLHHLAIVRIRKEEGEKAGKSQTSQETCLDQLILCFRRKSEEDVSISQPTDIGGENIHFFLNFFQGRIELS
jgi:hypothetical protein